MKYLSLIVGLILMLGLAQASWLDTSFPYRQVLNILNPNIVNYTDFVLNLTFDSATPIAAGKLLSNCSDLRFSYVNQSGGEVELPFFLYQDKSIYGTSNGKCAGGSANASVFLRMPVINTTTTVYIYYGNSLVQPKSNPNTTYLFYDYPTGATINLTKWINVCGAGTTCDVVSNSIRLKGGGSNWARIRPKDFTNSGNLTNKLLLFMGNKVSGGVGYSIVETNITSGAGWFIPVTNVFVPYRVNYNASGSFGLNASSNTELTPNGNPRVNVSDNITFATGNDALDIMYITNITLVSLSKLPIVVNYLYEQQNTNFNFSALDDDDGKNIYFNVSVTNGASTYQSQTSINHYNFTQYFPYGSITVTFQNSTYHDANVSSTNDYTDKTITGTLIPRISKNFTLLAYDVSGTQIYFNATLSNSSTSYTTENAISITNKTNEIPYGSLTLAFQNASYYPASLYTTNNYSKQIIKIYLVPISAPTVHYVSFHVIGTTSTPISDVLITAKRLVGSTYVDVGQCKTDSSGTCVLILDYSYSHTIYASKTGYTTVESLITPSGTDYTITLGGGTANPTYTPSFTDIELSITPDKLDFLNNWTIINYTISSTYSELSLYGLNVTYAGVVIFSQMNNTPSGGNIIVNVTTWNSTLTRTNNITVYGIFQKTGQSVFYVVKYYRIYENFGYYNSTLTKAMAMARASGTSSLFFIIPILAIVAMVAAWLNRSLSVGIGLGVFSAIFLLLLFGFISDPVKDVDDFFIILFLILLALAIAKYRSQGGAN